MHQIRVRCRSDIRHALELDKWPSDIELWQRDTHENHAWCQRISEQGQFLYGRGTFWLEERDVDDQLMH